MHTPIVVALHHGTYLAHAAAVSMSVGVNAQVERLKRLIDYTIERGDRGHVLCRIGFHSMAWNPRLHIGRKTGLPWSRYQLHYFQLGFCPRCGRAKQRWIGKAPDD